MKKVLSVLTIMAMLSLGVNAQTKKDGTPDMRYSANKQSSSTSASSYSTTSSSSSRPVYSGQTHTTSHGGTYPGSTNAHHKNGTYANPSSNNNYGIHKKKN